MRAGLIDMLAATAAFTTMIGLVKVATGWLDPLEVVFWRAVLGVAMTLALPGPRRLQVHRPGLLTLRTLLGSTTMMCGFTAAQGLSVAQLSLIGKLQPLLVAVAAPLVLGASERVPARVGWALSLGLAGCAVLLAPDVGTPALRWSLWALLGAVTSAGAHLCVRQLRRTEAPRTIVTWFQVGAAALSAGWVLARTGALPRWPPADAWPAVLAVGLAATAGQLWMTRAYRRSPAPAVATITYTGPLLAVVGDVLVFGVWPDVWGWLGGSLVVVAGLWLLAGREEAGERQPATAPR